MLNEEFIYILLSLYGTKTNEEKIIWHFKFLGFERVNNLKIKMQLLYNKFVYLLYIVQTDYGNRHSYKPAQTAAF